MTKRELKPVGPVIPDRAAFRREISKLGNKDRRYLRLALSAPKGQHNAVRVIYMPGFAERWNAIAKAVAEKQKAKPKAKTGGRRPHEISSRPHEHRPHEGVPANRQHELRFKESNPNV